MLRRVICLQPLLTLILHTVVHHSAFATLGRRPDDLTRVCAPIVASGSLLIFLFVNAGASVLDPCGLSVGLLLLRHFLPSLLVLIVFTALASCSNLVPLLLDLVGLLSLVLCSLWAAGLSATLAGHAT